MSQAKRTCLLASVALSAVAAALGCSEPNQSQPKASNAGPPPSVKLTVLVAGDAELAEGVRLLRGEWKARSGGEVDVTSMSLEELDAAESIAADVLIFPSRRLGALVERSLLRPVRESVLASPEYGANEIFPAIRNGEMSYGGQTMALPLGSPPLLLYSRLGGSDEEGSSRQPQTWESYRRLVAAGTPELKSTTPPMAGRAAAYTLIARAMAYCESARRPEALFDPESMAPRIAEPPWVRALTEIAEEAAAEVEGAPLGFVAAIRAVHEGKSVASMGWPSLLQEIPSAADAAREAEFAPLPTAVQVFSQTREEWENPLRPSGVTLLAVEGRLVGVSQSSRNAVTAFKLCQWLTSGDIAVQLSSRSQGTLWFRHSQAGKHGRWLGQHKVRDAAVPIPQVIAEALATETPVMTPRVPAIDEYLGVLAEAVRSAQPDEQSAQAALATAAADWEEITERLGREAQARAYRRHLGIEPM